MTPELAAVIDALQTLCWVLFAVTLLFAGAFAFASWLFPAPLDPDEED